ncbi:MAG TPA: hypothetical protein VMT62_11855 [Syntrophorhabdaceae bacterium]|nr:hypothetical protein [Syntrophorhabdaceae bacterium]
MIETVASILGRCHDSTTNISPTILYSEGWMTRLLVAVSIDAGIHFQDIDFSRIQNWYSEGLLSSPFLPRTRTDRLAEGYTHTDMALGDFTVDSSVRGDISITGSEGIFGVIEAKMGSRLSPGTKHVPVYNQASRNLACIAFNTLSTRHRIFFIVAAPEKKIEEHEMRKQVDMKVMLAQIANRFDLYERQSPVYALKEEVLRRAGQCVCSVISYESWLERLGPHGSYSPLVEFKERCYAFNKIA